MATINAASCSYAHVSAAITAASSGDTVNVPAGSATWSSRLAITKGILLVGAGIGNTVITSGYTAPYTNMTYASSYLINYNPGVPTSTHLFRFSGFTINCDNKCGGLSLAHSTSVGNELAGNVRIHHNSFLNTKGAGNYPVFLIYGHFCGVVDNNYSDYTGPLAYIFGRTTTTWTNLSYEYDTADQVYFEDNDSNRFHYMLFGNTGGGGRWCGRYNTASWGETTLGLYPAVDMHGNQPGANPANMGAVFYENTIRLPSNKGCGIFDQRGGKALCYNNNIITTGAVSAKAREEYNDAVGPLPATGPDGQPQHVSNSYYWNNTKNGSTLVNTSITQVVDYGGLIGDVPQWDIDCWRQTTGFDGSTGMGVGLLSQRPTRLEMLDLSPVPSAGIGWWATDEKRLYRWTGNIWYIYYTPYTYPHPLREEGTAYLLSDYYENGILDHVFKVSPLAQPSHIYVALTKSTIEDEDTGQTLPSEISGGGYARKACDTWDVASSGQTANTGAITFNQATANWGAITDMALCDSVTGGNVLVYGKMDSTRTVNSGDTLAFLAGTVIAKLE